MTLISKLLTLLTAMSLASSIEAQDAITPKPVDTSEAFEARVYEATDGTKLPYRLLKPIDFDPQQKYPLVIFLHGAGERGDDNAKQLVHGGGNLADDALRRRHPAFVIFPQCAADKKWVEVPWDAQAHKAPEDPGETMNAVFALVDSLQKEFPIDAERVYGVGLSMGGYGTWDIVQRKPDLLAAAVPICGGGDPAHAAAFKSTPVWAFHGGADPVVPASRSREMINTAQATGGRPIYTEYEGVGHDSWTQTFDNRLVWDWLFTQKK